MSELRLCPNCHGEAHILPEGDYHEVKCEDCGSYAQGHRYEDAVIAWNWGEVYENATED